MIEVGWSDGYQLLGIVIIDDDFNKLLPIVVVLYPLCYAPSLSLEHISQKYLRILMENI